MSADPEAEPTPPSVAAEHLSIGEVVALLRPEFSDLTDSKIRFLEDRKLISPARTSSGYRSFGPHDIEVLRWILTRQRDQYLPLSIIGERIDRGEHLADIWGIGVAGPPEVGPAEVGTSEPSARIASNISGNVESNTAARDAHQLHDAAHVADALLAEPSAAASFSSWSVPIAPDADRVYSAHELSAASGLSLTEVKELTEFGLLMPLAEDDQTPSPGATEQAVLALEPPEPRYGSGALLIARITREFSVYGLQARHLRVIRNAAVRDAAVFEQGIQPVLHAGGASADADAQRALGRLVALCERLRAQVMSESLRRYWA